MRFRQLITPTYKNLYDVCLNQAPFYRNEEGEGRRNWVKGMRVKVGFECRNRA